MSSGLLVRIMAESGFVVVDMHENRGIMQLWNKCQGDKP